MVPSPSISALIESSWFDTFVKVLLPFVRNWTIVSRLQISSPETGSLAQVIALTEPPGLPKARA